MRIKDLLLGFHYSPLYYSNLFSSHLWSWMASKHTCTSQNTTFVPGTSIWFCLSDLLPYPRASEANERLFILQRHRNFLRQRLQRGKYFNTCYFHSYCIQCGEWKNKSFVSGLWPARVYQNQVTDLVISTEIQNFSDTKLPRSEGL